MKSRTCRAGALSPAEAVHANSYERDALRQLREPAIRCLDRIPIKECGEPLVSLKGISPRVRLKAPLPWVRERVAEMVVEAAANLPKGLFLVITTGLRSLKMQESAYRRYSRMLRRQHPDWPHSVLRREANRFLHPTDSVSPPGHCTGGSVDVGLAYGNGRMLDTVSSERPQETTWATFYPHLTATARGNRARLYSVMVEAGFTNCYEEWWHYSFGDSGWAARSGKPFARYGIPAELPPVLARLISRVENAPPRQIRL